MCAHHTIRRYRIKHNWAPLALSDDPRSKWVGDIQKADIERKMEELGALLALAQEANSRLKDIESTAESSLTRIHSATSGFVKMEDTVTDLKESVGRMYTKRQAVRNSHTNMFFTQIYTLTVIVWLLFCL